MANRYLGTPVRVGLDMEIAGSGSVCGLEESGAHCRSIGCWFLVAIRFHGLKELDQADSGSCRKIASGTDWLRLRDGFEFFPAGVKAFGFRSGGCQFLVELGGPAAVLLMEVG